MLLCQGGDGLWVLEVCDECDEGFCGTAARLGANTAVSGYGRTANISKGKDTMKTRIAALLVLAGCIGVAAMSTTAYAAIRGCGQASGYAVSANSNTTCGFARNVASAYARGSVNPRVYSSATRRYIRMTCSQYQGVKFVSCRGGKSAYVRLS